MKPLLADFYHPAITRTWMPPTIVIQKMKPMTQKINYQFDFEIGTLVKSPCLECHYRPLFPRCMQTCRILDEIHAVLAEAVSCTRRA
jgi:hypothetical protein